MSVAEKFRTGEAVGRGEITLDPERAREKLRDNRLSDPHRWILEVVAAANQAGATFVRVDLDADEFFILIGGAQLSQDELAGLWQAPFSRESRAFTRHIAYGLIGAEALRPTRILLRSQQHAAQFGPEHDRGLLEKAITHLYPDSGTADAVQIYVRVPLAISRVLRRRDELPEVRYLTTHAMFSTTPIYLRDTLITRSMSVDFGDRHLVLDHDGLRGAMEVVRSPASTVTFVAHGVITESVEFQSLVPVRAVVATDRLEYDLSGTKIIRDKKLETVLDELRVLAREALLAQVRDEWGRNGVPDSLKTAVLFKLIEENYHKRVFYEPVSEVDQKLAQALLPHPMWACAGTAPPKGPKWAVHGVPLVSLADACPDGKHLHRANEKLPTRYGDRPVLLADDEKHILSPGGKMPVAHLERFLEVESYDVTTRVRKNAKRMAAEKRWRSAEWLVDLKSIALSPNLVVETSLVGVAYTGSKEPEPLQYLHRQHVLANATGPRGVYVVFKEVPPNEDLSGPSDNETTRAACANLAEALGQLVVQIGQHLPVSPTFWPDHFAGLQSVVDSLVSKEIPDLLTLCGSAARAAELDRAQLAGLPLFVTFARERLMLERNRRVANTLRNAFDEELPGLLSAQELLSTGKPVAMCRAHEFERLSEAGFDRQLAASHTLIVGDPLTARFVRVFSGEVPIDAMGLFHAAEGQKKFEALPVQAHALPHQSYYQTRISDGPHGRISAGLAGIHCGKITVVFRHADRVLEEITQGFPAGEIVVVVDDDRIQPDRSYQRVLRDTGYDGVMDDSRKVARELVFAFIRNARTLAGAPAELLRQLSDAADPDLRELKVFEDLDGNFHPIGALKSRRRLSFVRRGFAPIPALVVEEPVFVLDPNLDLEALGIRGTDVSDTPEHRARIARGKLDFQDRARQEIALRRSLDPTGVPREGVALAELRFSDGKMEGVVGFVGPSGKFARVTMLHERRLVAVHTVALPWGEFEVVLENPKIELDTYHSEVTAGLRAYDAQVVDACKRCLLQWLNRPTRSAAVMESAMLSQSQLASWSRELVQALKPRGEAPEKVRTEQMRPEQVRMNEEKPAGPEQDLFAFLEMVVGSSGVLANVHVRGFELHELGTGLPCQAEGATVHLDPTHPVIQAALGTDDPVWQAMSASSAFTALNLKWLAITDDHEEEFSRRMLAYMAKALG
jgi:hypothetical protein